MIKSRKSLRKKANKEDTERERKRRRNLSRILSKMKGKLYEEEFVCDLCRHDRIIGYEYAEDGHVYHICKFCYNSIYDIRPKTKLIYTPMGNNIR